MGKLVSWVVIILVGMVIARILGHNAARRRERDANSATRSGARQGGGAGGMGGPNGTSGMGNASGRSGASGANGSNRPNSSSHGAGSSASSANRPINGAQAQNIGAGGYRYGNTIGKLFARATGAAVGLGDIPGPATASRPAQAMARTDGRPAEQMVRCAHCGIYLPRSEALLTGGKTWCDLDHARLGESHHN